MRYMALDLGDKRIGIALSDASGIIARPLKVIQRTSRVNDFDLYTSLITEYGVDAVIVGLPLNMDGTEGKQAAWVRDYTNAFSEIVRIPITFWDERLSTEEAYGIIKNGGRQPGNDEIDAVAAAVILQSYLDSQS